MNKNDFFTKSQIETDLNRVKELINTGVFIKLWDLTQKLVLLENRIDFKEDIKSGDITDLIRRIRYAVCHVDSGEHMLKSKQQVKFSFNIAYGKVNLASIGEKKITSDYEDDICFFFGENKIYLKRHIIRCIQEAEKKIQELYKTGK
jgi:hypothetical protein